MPAVTVYYPRGLFDSTDKVRFRRTVKQRVAIHMDAVNPVTKKRTKFGEDPDGSIDLILIPYDHDDAEVTALCVGTIATFEWPDRVTNLDERMKAITEAALAALPPHELRVGQDSISFSFLGMLPGSWCAL